MFKGANSLYDQGIEEVSVIQTAFDKELHLELSVLLFGRESPASNGRARRGISERRRFPRYGFGIFICVKSYDALRSAFNADGLLSCLDRGYTSNNLD
jgi:hypothetical protein